MSPSFRSLRARLLIPLVACSLTVAILIGWVSYRWSGRATEQSLATRLQVIRSTLEQARFPLNQQVVQSLADLSGVELATYDPRGRRVEFTHPVAPTTWEDAVNEEALLVAGFRSGWFVRRVGSSDGPSVSHILVMFDEQELQRSRLGAALFPLLTGLSSTLILSLLAWLLSERMVHRISRLEQSVNRIAAGDFDSRATSEGTDELGRLEAAVRRMGTELRSLWSAVHRQERQKLIHQMAAGLAHQLRNSLTGARMAIELHEQRNPSEVGQGLQVAQRELRRTEDYVQRILSIADEEHRTLQACSIESALQPIYESLHILAQHHRVQLKWDLPSDVGMCRVSDGGILSAAIENLVINALQSGADCVQMHAKRIAMGDHNKSNSSLVQLEITDNGPGPSPQKFGVQDARLVDWFEPFVTTKPEGLGLGLTIVKRAADKLGGEANWSREENKTVFSLTAKVVE